MSTVISSPTQIHFRNIPSVNLHTDLTRPLNVLALVNPHGPFKANILRPYGKGSGDQPPPTVVTPPPMALPPGQSPPTTTNTPTTTGSDTSAIVTALLSAYASAFGSSGSVGGAQPVAQPQTAPVVVAPAPAAGGASTGQVVLIVLTMAALAFGIYKYAKRKKGGEREA
jgi:hypothetical protein